MINKVKRWKESEKMKKTNAERREEFRNTR
jgi:hypothetical protein